ncbi:hypothetical protein T484DRAFT_1899292 [Baffinella frigidus]|nr:hypothetical protein T484DRAFT_1899292 [Cryptophyta sp. CCMP2293]
MGKEEAEAQGPPVVEDAQPFFDESGGYHVKCDGNTVIAMYDWEPRRQLDKAQEQAPPPLQASESLANVIGNGEEAEHDPQSAAAAAAAARPSYAKQKQEGNTRASDMKMDEVTFPWDMASGLSRETFSDGCHEFLVQVGGFGLVGFVDASIADERQRLREHWITRGNAGRTWLLHTSGFLVQGDQVSQFDPAARLASHDKVMIQLDTFRGTATFTATLGFGRELGSVEGIHTPVKLATQMFDEGQKLSVLSYRDCTASLSKKELGDSYMIKGESCVARAAVTLFPEVVVLLTEAEKAFDLASRALSAAQDSEGTSMALQKRKAAKTKRLAIEGVHKAGRKMLPAAMRRRRSSEEAGDVSAVLPGDSGAPAAAIAAGTSDAVAI